jgi:hypothetical protein
LQKRGLKKSNRTSSGQLLVIAALAIAVLISSTTIYIYETTREAKNPDALPIDNFVLAQRQSTRNAVTSSLANASNGGAKHVLAANLAKFAQVSLNMHQFGICNLAYSLRNDSSYDSGVLLSWNTNGTGISGAYANLTLQLHGMNSRVSLNYSVNVETELEVSGSYTMIGNGEKNVSLTCRIYNEKQPALAKNITVFFENAGNWIQVGMPERLSIIDYGNGTYLISFAVTVLDPVRVSVSAVDLRSVFVQANATCLAA